MTMNDTLNTAIRSEEYRSLQEEHKKIRGYIFERPLLIAAGIAALAQYTLINEPESNQLTLVLKLLAFPLAIYVFYYNMAFTAKNLVTDARIIAYLQLFHEDCSTHWIGWENSLRHYRKWMNNNMINGDLEDRIAKNIEMEYIYSNNWFYIQIYRFHIIIMFFILVMWSITAYYVNSTAPLILIFIFVLILCYFLNPLYPSKHDNLIEKQRAIWIMVYRDSIHKSSASIPNYGNKTEL